MIDGRIDEILKDQIVELLKEDGIKKELKDKVAEAIRKISVPELSQIIYKSLEDAIANMSTHSVIKPILEKELSKLRFHVDVKNPKKAVKK